MYTAVVSATDENGEPIDLGQLPRRIRFAIWVVNYFNFGRMTPKILSILLGQPARRIK